MSAPTVTSISPSSGPLGGGTSVTITGTSFTGATGVKIGGATASFTFVNDTTLTCTTPSSGSAGTASVVVTNADGPNANNSLFTYGPTVTSVSPPSGLPAGGTSVTITGTNFTGATDVSIGGVSVASFHVVNATTITCTTPGGSAGPASVLVTAPYGTNAPNSLYTYGPTITSLAPASGLPSGGTVVTITGLGFAGASGVTIGGVAATGFSLSTDKTQITCTTPAGSLGSASVVVTASIGSNADNSLFTYALAPTVSGISPNTGSSLGGIDVTITGTDFTGASGVTIGGVPATDVVVASSTSITCTTPAGSAGPASVLVTTPSGTNAANTLYTNVAPPAVTSITPPTGLPAGGASVTIKGTHFTGATSVTIGGVAVGSLDVVNDTTITCTTPAGSAAASVQVTTLGGTNAANTLFTYQPPPAVTSLSPPIGASTGGTSVTITGANFIGATSVTIGGVAAGDFTVVNATSIICTTPAGSAGTASVVVTTAAGTNAANELFLYVVAAPTDTYIYLKGGRGDGFVPLWTGALAEEGMVSDTGGAVGTAGQEASDPYRDIHNYTTNVAADIQWPSGLVTSAGILQMMGTALTPKSTTLTSLSGLVYASSGLPAGGLIDAYVPYTVGPISSSGNANVLLTGLTPQVSDEVAHEKPRQFARVSTWLIFISQNGLPYKFRKDQVLGWGSQPRSS